MEVGMQNPLGFTMLRGRPERSHAERHVPVAPPPWPPGRLDRAPACILALSRRFPQRCGFEHLWEFVLPLRRGARFYTFQTHRTPKAPRGGPEGPPRIKLRFRTGARTPQTPSQENHVLSFLCGFSKSRGWQNPAWFAGGSTFACTERTLEGVTLPKPQEEDPKALPELSFVPAREHKLHRPRAKNVMF